MVIQYLIQRLLKMGYSRFCELYRAVERRLSPLMRQTHAAGDKAFVDYSGKKVPIVDPLSGEGADGGAVHRGARRVQPHLCRCHLDAELAGLDWRPWADVPVLWFGTAL